MRNKEEIINELPSILNDKDRFKLLVELLLDLRELVDSIDTNTLPQ